jgi:GrpB-like predicted nucleotidyltransferase (UPF0157 family)
MNEEILISDYDPDWARSYSEEARRIVDRLGPRIRDIQHIGSTAVPGLAAKPIIDIMVAMDEIVKIKDAIVADIAGLGYVNVPHDEDAQRLFFRKGTPRTHHLHVVAFRSWGYWQHIMFRNYLIEHPISAEEYECLKRVLADAHRNDREAYVEGKKDFVEGILWRATKDRLIVPK